MFKDVDVDVLLRKYTSKHRQLLPSDFINDFNAMPHIPTHIHTEADYQELPKINSSPTIRLPKLDDKYTRTTPQPKIQYYHRHVNSTRVIPLTQLTSSENSKQLSRQQSLGDVNESVELIPQPKKHKSRKVNFNCDVRVVYDSGVIKSEQLIDNTRILKYRNRMFKQSM